ncbi:MAG: hypothetical protein CML20_07080 [Rheinheimera sp.]|mgnify:CR=1 FL=1|nr:hypothetical protein [Rheinheimera sp.]
MPRLLCCFLVIPCYLCAAQVYADNVEDADKVEDILRIEVIGRAPNVQHAATELLSVSNSIDRTHISTDSLASLLQDLPMVNLSGQGGLLQSVNIRGSARWRVQTLVEGIPIHTERRAGSAAEFLPPSMVAQARVYPAVASTQLGAGAIGGSIDFSLRVPQSPGLLLRYGTNNNYREVLVSGEHAASNVSWMVNHQHANNSKDGNSNPIQDRFEQHSLVLRKQSAQDKVRDALLLYSGANNVAKASADDPSSRFTLYPTNEHALAKVVFNWHNATVYAHNSQLTTHITRPSRRFNALESNALNTGMHISNSLALSAAGDWAIHWRTGVDARLGVQVNEREAISAAAPSVSDQRILDAQQWELYGAADATKKVSSGMLAAGTRLSSTTQSSNLRTDLISSSEQDSSVSAFIGYRHALSPSWALSGYLSHGYRVPSLTERFYRGETPRGQVLGDPDLRSEQANNVDVSLHYKALSSAFYLSVFQHNISHYIEQITLSPSLQQYRNLDRAKIAGVNYQLSHTFSAAGLAAELKLGGQWLTGEDNAGKLIADIVPAQHRMSLSIYAGKSEGFVALTHRSASDDSVPGELPTNRVNSLSMGYNYALSPAWQLSLNVTNITDAYYVTSRDDLAPPARGRQWVFSTEYHF